MLKDDVRFLYLHDDNGRVLTVARNVNLDTRTVVLSFSVNRTAGPNSAKPGDKFSKVVGRNAALSRMQMGKTFSFVMPEDARPIESILTFLADPTNDSVPRCVRDVATKHMHTAMYEQGILDEQGKFIKNSFSFGLLQK